MKLKGNKMWKVTSFQLDVNGHILTVHQEPMRQDKNVKRLRNERKHKVSN